jgi:hypothetical protein
MTAVSTKVLQPERSHWLHDILFSAKPYYLLGKRAENLNRQKELNVVSTEVLQPEPSHWLHDIPISNKTLILTG